MADEAQVLKALGRIVDPARGVDIVAANLVKSLKVSGGSVSFVLEVDPARGGAMEPLRAAAEAAIKGLDGVTSVSAVMTAHSASGQAPKTAPKAIRTTGITVAIAKTFKGWEKIAAMCSLLSDPFAGFTRNIVEMAKIRNPPCVCRFWIASPMARCLL